MTSRIGVSTFVAVVYFVAMSVILFSLLSSTGCSKKKNIDDTTIITLSSTIEKTLVDTAYFSRSRIVPLETNDHSLIRRITRICTDDNKLFIFDRSINKIVIFDMDGKYVTDIHQVGSGPSEYQALSDFCLDVDKKQIILLCNRPYKIIKFDYSGKFIEEKSFSDLYLNILSNSNFIYCNKWELSSDDTDSYMLTCFDSDMNPVSEFLPMRRSAIFSPTLSLTSKLMPGQPLTSTLNDYFTRIFDNSIYCINNGHVEKKYAFDFHKYNFPKTLLEQGSKDEISKKTGEKEHIYSITEVSESEKYLMFKTNMAICILNKQTQVLEAYESIKNTGIQVSSDSYFSIGNSSRMVGSVFEAYLFLAFKKYASEHPGDDDLELRKLVEKIEEDSNPIVVLYEISQ